MSIATKKFKVLTLELADKFKSQMTDPWVLVNIAEQNLYLLSNTEITQSYPVSTSQFGVGNKQDSQKTPLGAHQIAECIGDQQALGAVFKARRATGEIAHIVKSAESTDLDLIITRILRLRGLEPDVNQGEGIDSYHRYIYIHGTHEEGMLGIPASHGCVRMASKDIIQLYSQVSINTFVYIA